MKADLCCKVNPPTVLPVGGTKARPRFVSILQWGLPATLFALIPKCPLCFAACTLVGCGAGLSVSTETYIRIYLTIICTGLICYLILRRFTTKASHREAGARSKSTLSILQIQSTEKS